MRLLEVDTKLHSVSKKSPKSLILRIPASIRDFMEFDNETRVKLEVVIENDTKILKISKVD